MTVSITKAVVGGSENTWGATTNQALDDIVAVLNGTTASTPDITAGSFKVSGTAVTSVAADLNILSGAAAAGVTATEFGYLNGATSAIQTQIDAKAPIASPTFTGTTTAPTVSSTTITATTVTGTTVNVTTVDFGDWTITESSGVLYFATGGTNKMKLDASGNLTVVGNVTAYGTM
jgi:hypothetical protein